MNESETNNRLKVFGFLGIPKNESLLIIGLYIVSHIHILLISDSIFWDDWTIFNTDSDIIIDKFRQAGIPFDWVGYLHVMLFSIGPWVYKLLTFILFFLTGILLLKIIERQNGFWVGHRSIIVILFMILPLNPARVAAINFPYTLCYFSFFLGWWLLDRHRYVAFILFLFSFTTNSLLCFYAIPVVDYLLRNNKKWEIISLKTIKENWVLFCLPFLFFGIKQLFFKPTEVYEGYNSNFSFAGLQAAIHLQFAEIKSLVQAFSVNAVLMAAIIVLAIFLYISVSKIGTKKNQERGAVLIKNTISVILIGCILILLAEFPYLILGKAPRFEDWHSRHQILMPLGLAVLLYGVIFYLGRRLRNIFFACIISLCIISNVLLYFEYYLDWKKHNEIIRLVADQEMIRQGRLILFEDHTKIPNARGRTVRFYEWNGMLAYAYGDEKRFGVNKNEWSREFCIANHKFFSPHYKAGHVNYANTKKVVLVKIYREDKASRSVIEQFKHLVTPKLRLVVEDDLPYCRHESAI